MKKLGLATALVLTLAFGAGSVFAAQNSNSPATGGGTMTASASGKHSRRHHRKAHHRRHHKAKAANANT